MQHPDWLRATWQQPGVASLMSTRAGGCSSAPWDSMNLGIAVGDMPEHVARNRELFQQALGAAPVFMKQVHGTRVLRLTQADLGTPVQEADACITTETGLACTVQVADCMPVLLAAPGAVGAAHAGWRGLAGGIVEATVNQLCEAAACEPAQIECWLGACIGPASFEVGADVLEGFGVDPVHVNNHADVSRFKPLREGKWLANLPQLARDRLAALGVERVTGGEWCTVRDTLEGRSRFFSFRRDGVTGRMAASIWRS
ncbi:MAG TPA: peptidoglycan editing factor PgeF [Rhizobacter sp.]|nr:peptidoglycan editing factor PgeF [Rhizobacter sp.]